MLKYRVMDIQQTKTCLLVLIAACAGRLHSIVSLGVPSTLGRAHCVPVGLNGCYEKYSKNEADLMDINH
jgi:hypothetical protein